jgi:hypothetical protein
MKTLSFRKAIYRVTSWVCWVWGGMRSAWLILRFYFFPTEENLLISFWIDHAHYRRVVPKNTVYDFLDSRVRYLEESVANPDGRRSVRRMERSLLKALYREPVRKIVVDFLESPSPKKSYRPVVEAIRKAWRMEDEAALMTGADVHKLENPDKTDELRIGKKVDSAEVGGDNQPESREGGQVMERLLNARAYIIAVQLWLELRGEESEFESLSRRLPDLGRFIQSNFAVERLPGRLEEFKGYSYKPELNGLNRAKKGQLRAPFRQIMGHPEVFGEDVAARAKEMLEKYFR